MTHRLVYATVLERPRNIHVVRVLEEILDVAEIDQSPSACASARCRGTASSRPTLS
jgi:hypothetical protein